MSKNEWFFARIMCVVIGVDIVEDDLSPSSLTLQKEQHACIPSLCHDGH